MVRITIALGEASGKIARVLYSPFTNSSMILLHDVDINLSMHPSYFDDNVLTNAIKIEISPNNYAFRYDAPRHWKIATILNFYQPLGFECSSVEKELWLYTKQELSDALKIFFDESNVRGISFTDAVACILERLDIKHSIKLRNPSMVKNVLKQK